MFTRLTIAVSLILLMVWIRVSYEDNVKQRRARETVQKTVEAEEQLLRMADVLEETGGIYGLPRGFDPWDNPVIVDTNDTQYVLRSAGPDGKSYTRDDIAVIVQRRR